MGQIFDRLVNDPGGRHFGAQIAMVGMTGMSIEPNGTAKGKKGGLVKKGSGPFSQTFFQPDEVTISVGFGHVSIDTSGGFAAEKWTSRARLILRRGAFGSQGMQSQFDVEADGNPPVSLPVVESFPDVFVMHDGRTTFFVQLTESNIT